MAFDASLYFTSLDDTLQQERSSYVGAQKLKQQLKLFDAFTIHEEFENSLFSVDAFLNSVDLYTFSYPIKISCLRRSNSIEFEYNESLSSRISTLRREYFRTKSAAILLEISELIKEVYKNVSIYVSRQKSKVRQLRNCITKSRIRDLRFSHRNIIRFRFKNMSDCSGSDSEAFNATYIKHLKSFTNQTNSYELYKSKGRCKLAIEYNIGA